jgi:hypothetical protein
MAFHLGGRLFGDAQVRRRAARGPVRRAAGRSARGALARTSGLDASDKRWIDPESGIAGRGRCAPDRQRPVTDALRRSRNEHDPPHFQK